MRRSLIAQISEGLIPRPNEFVAVLFGQVKNVVGFVTAKPLDKSEFEGIEPEFGGTVVALHVDVRRLESVSQVKEEAKTAFA